MQLNKLIKTFIHLVLSFLIFNSSIAIGAENDRDSSFDLVENNLQMEGENLLAFQQDNENDDSIVEDEATESEEASPEEEPVVPTRIQWLILSAIALVMVLVSLKFKAHQLTTEGELHIYPITKTFSIPLHPAIYKFMVFLTASMALIGFAICLSIYDSVFMPDIVGVSIAGPIFAYLIHLLYLMEKGKDK